jgi:hypothetical protein
MSISSIHPENLIYACMTLEHHYWNDIVSGQDKVKKGIRALVDIHLPHSSKHGVGVPEVRAAICETYLSLMQLNIEQYRNDHITEMGTQFLIQSAYDECLDVYQTMPSTSEVISDTSLTLSKAGPILSDIISKLDGDVVNNPICVAMRYINHFTQTQNNKTVMSHWFTRRNVSTQFMDSYLNIASSNCRIGQCLKERTASLKIQLVGNTEILLLNQFIAPLLKAHLTSEPLQIRQADMPVIMKSSKVTEEQTNLVISVINDFVKELYSEPPISIINDNIDTTISRTETIHLRKALEVLSLELESTSAKTFYLDYASDDTESAYQLSM